MTWDKGSNWNYFRQNGETYIWTFRVNDKVKVNDATLASLTNVVQPLGTFKVFDVLTDMSENL